MTFLQSHPNLSVAIICLIVAAILAVIVRRFLSKPFKPDYDAEGDSRREPDIQARSESAKRTWADITSKKATLEHLNQLQ